MFIRHMMIATNETMHVVMNVTKMTQTPYAFPSLVVWWRVSVIQSRGRKCSTHIAIRSSDNNSPDHQQPIGQWHIDLAVEPF